MKSKSNTVNKALRKPSSLFDIDGVIYPVGLAYLEFPHFLAMKGLFDESHLRQMKYLHEKYKAEGISYREYVEQLPALFYEGLTGQEVTAVEQAGRSYVTDELIPRFYPYAQRLVHRMNTMTSIVAISGSPMEPLLPLQDERILGFSRVIATEGEKTPDGLYSGKVRMNVSLYENKDRLVQEYLHESKLDKELLAKCYGFGDTRQDLPILERVGRPFVFFDEKQFEQDIIMIAKERGWGLLHREEDIFETLNPYLSRDFPGQNL